MAENKQPVTERENVELKVPCEVYSRVVGYLRPVQAWNQGKRQEFAERKEFKVDEKMRRRLICRTLPSSLGHPRPSEK